MSAPKAVPRRSNHRTWPGTRCRQSRKGHPTTAIWKNRQREARRRAESWEEKHKSVSERDQFLRAYTHDPEWTTEARSAISSPIRLIILQRNSNMHARVADMSPSHNRDVWASLFRVLHPIRIGMLRRRGYSISHPFDTAVVWCLQENRG